MIDKNIYSELSYNIAFNEVYTDFWVDSVVNKTLELDSHESLIKIEDFATFYYNTSAKFLTTPIANATNTFYTDDAQFFNLNTQLNFDFFDSAFSNGINLYELSQFTFNSTPIIIDDNLYLFIPEVENTVAISNSPVDSELNHHYIKPSLTISDTELNEAEGVAAVVQASAEVSISNDDAKPSFAISNIDINEDEGFATLTVTKSGNITLESSVKFNTVDGSAEAGTDYTAQSGILTFAPGEISQTLTIEINNDNFFESDENFSVALSEASNATIDQISAEITIKNDDLRTSETTTASPKSTIDLNNLNSQQGLKIETVEQNTNFHISSAGDVNGDGINDFIVINANNHTYYIENTLNDNLENLFASYTFNHENSSANNIGDINADGYDDFATTFNAGESQSEALIYYGFSDVNSQFIGLQAQSTTLSSYSNLEKNSSIASAGDINGDGFDDFIIASPDNNLGNGDVTLVFGEDGRGSAASTLTISNTISSNQIGLECKMIGDINGDGLNDMAIQGSNISYVIYGNNNPLEYMPTDVSHVNGFNGFSINNAGSLNITGVGDIDGNGFDDLLIGDSSYNNNTGATYLILNNENSIGNSLDYANNAIKISGSFSGHQFGMNVDAAGDINGDSLADIIISALDAQGSEQAFVIYGSTTPDAQYIGLPSSANFINGNNGFQIDNLDSQSEFEVMGDLNGDGLDDLLISSQNNISGDDYVIYGEVSKDSILGNAGDETLVGSQSDDFIHGGQGNDEIIGQDGNDILDGGAGNDVLHFDAADLLSVDGGSGFDTLLLNQGNIDLTKFNSSRSPIENIEQINMDNEEANELALSWENIIDLTGDSDSSDGLFISGDSSDKVTISNEEWIKGDTTTVSGTTFQEYSSGAANVYIDVEINQVEIVST